MSDPFPIPPPTPAQRPRSRREVLWDELEQLHERVLMDPPTATLILDNLEAEVERRYRSPYNEPRPSAKLYQA